MDEIKKARLCRHAMSHALETIRELYSNNQDWEDEKVKTQYYKALDVSTFFFKLENKLLEKNLNEWV